MTDTEKLAFINKEYVDNNKSFKEIADAHNTYANKIRRDAKKLGVSIRSRSEAQKNALQTGKHKHPTKGKVRSDEEKQKIGMSMYKSWKSQDAAQRKNRSLKAKAQWQAMSDVEKENLQTAAHKAIRETSKTGSKLEKFLLRKLIENGFKPEFHKEQILSNTKLQIDIFVPETNTAIEVDGPSHFEAVWGDESLARNQKYDQNKNGLIIGRGMRLIRIKQANDYSPARAQIIFTKLNEMLQKIKNNAIDSSLKILHIED